MVDEFRFYQQLQDEIDAEFTNTVEIVFWERDNESTINEDYPEIISWMSQGGLKIPYLRDDSYAGTGLMNELEIYGDMGMVCDVAILSPDGVIMDKYFVDYNWGDSGLADLKAWVADTIGE